MPFDDERARDDTLGPPISWLTSVTRSPRETTSRLPWLSSSTLHALGMLCIVLTKGLQPLHESRLTFPVLERRAQCNRA